MNISAPIVSRTTLYRQTFDTPLGKLDCIATQDRIISVDYRRFEENGPLQRRIAQHLPAREVKILCNSVLEEARFWLKKYFSGSPEKNPTYVRLLGSEFEKRVWETLMLIPCGQIVTYGEIARHLGSPNASRAVGQACHRNPIGILVPCHRVVGTSGNLTGYAGGIETKAFLLRLEKNIFTGSSVLFRLPRVNLSQSRVSSIKYRSQNLSVA